MNKIIKQFAEQANSQSKEVYEGDWPYNCAAWTGEELIEFAELIVNECVGIAKAGKAEAVATVIKETFGIEDDTSR